MSTIPAKMTPIANAVGPRMIAAIYARFSTDNQKDTSIDDQVRRSMELAERMGYIVPSEYIFVDAALSGGSTDKRQGYTAFMEAWKAGKFSAVIADTQARFFRDELECVMVKRLIIQSEVRVLTAKGLDTQTQSNWQVMWTFQGLMDAEQRQSVAFDVVRGMDGALARGCFVSPPPYGYTRVRDVTPSGDIVGGARFVINEVEAVIVRRIYAERLAGRPYAKIAAGLIADAIPSPSGKFWTISSVVNVLTNRLYSGVYAANDSSITRSRVKKGAKLGPLARKDYLHPELQLISQLDWDSVQPSSSRVSRTGRGGGKHWAAGLCTCGACGKVLSVKEGDKSFGLFCSHCAKNKALGADLQVPYFSGDGLRAVLTYAVQALFASAAHFQAFQSRLRELKGGGERAQLEAARARCDAADRSLVRLTKALMMVDDPEVLETFQGEIEAAKEAKRAAGIELSRLEAGAANFSPADLDAQLTVDPRLLVPLLFTKISGYQLRAVLSRLFPSVVLTREVGHKRAALVNVEFSSAAGAAMLSQTPALALGTVRSTFRLLTSSRHNTPPIVQLLDDAGAVVSATDALRVCSCCGETKAADEFGWQNRALQRRQTRCRACASAYYVAWRDKAKAAGLDATKAWRSKDPVQKNVVGPVNKCDVVAILGVPPVHVG